MEDNTDVRAYIREQLETAYHVIEAENGEIGIRQANTTIPDLIISDVMMPLMDGYTFANTSAAMSLQATSRLFC